MVPSFLHHSRSLGLTATLLSLVSVALLSLAGLHGPRHVHDAPDADHECVVCHVGHAPGVATDDVTAPAPHAFSPSLELPSADERPRDVRRARASSRAPPDA